MPKVAATYNFFHVTSDPHLLRLKLSHILNASGNVTNSLKKNSLIEKVIKNFIVVKNKASISTKNLNTVLIIVLGFLWGFLSFKFIYLFFFLCAKTQTIFYRRQDKKTKFKCKNFSPYEKSKFNTRFTLISYFLIFSQIVLNSFMRFSKF